MTRFELVPAGPFSLGASAAFLERSRTSARWARRRPSAGWTGPGCEPSPGDQALAELKRLPGIGDFSAELVLLRGAADPDHLPLHEPRLCRGAALAYDLDEPPDRPWLEERSQAWRPYRTWVVLLLRVLLEAETGEVRGTRGVGGR